ncbi:spore germination protein [Paenibacillus luteus]|uniref:spore germination protein n=1 Tax=Paenibacillus luteus TaxID=2545753 RepID=UPI001F4F3425|nr:spore germination protein [Paenibacillus luteus]
MSALPIPEFMTDPELRRLEQSGISADLGRSSEVINKFFVQCADLVIHSFSVGNGCAAIVVYFQGLTDTTQLETQVIRELALIEDPTFTNDSFARLSVSNKKMLKCYGEVVSSIVMGRTLLFVDGVESALSIDLTKFEVRALEEPQSESVVRGPREGFTENITTNMSLLRRRLRTQAMKTITFELGRYSKTMINMVYVDGIAREDIIQSISERLAAVDLDGILESAMIEEAIEDSTFSPFPQIQATERPDVAVAGLLEGRIVILTENTPIALIAPTTLATLMQSPEDYYQRFWIGTTIRWLRYLFFFIALLAPSVYVAILTFHQEMVPTTLLLRVAQSREEIPFPALLEALMMEVIFEALREAGIRLPKQVGSAVSIVGALVIGQAAIQAGLVSAPMVMVVAITGISSFMMPQYPASITLRLLRFPIMIMSGMFGLFGLMLSLLLIITHLCTLNSFGIPYLSPFAPLRPIEFLDTLIRAPLKFIKLRPGTYSGKNKRRKSVYARVRK